MLQKRKQQQQQANSLTMLKQQAPQSQQYQVPYSTKHYTMGPAHYHAPYLQPHQYGAPIPFNGHAQTISRSSNLHKQFAGMGNQTTTTTTTNARNLNLQQVYSQAADGGGGGGVAYDQSYLSGVAGGAPAKTLAMRPPRERGSIPASMGLHYGTSAAAGLANTIGHAQSRHYLEQLYAAQQQQQVASASLVTQHARFGSSNKPLCRCRVMYLGSSVPHITKNGLHGIQEPLRHLYPEEKFNTNSLRRKSREASTIDISHLSSSLGIDSWLSVWSNGLLLENVDEFGREIKRFFAIESLHYCAAIRFFDTSALAGGQQTTDTKQQPPVTASNQAIDPNNNNNDDATTTRQQDNQLSDNHNLPADTLSPSGGHETTQQEQQQQQRREEYQKRGVVRFLPLDAPIFACPGMLDANHPPVFAAIMRRTSGIKVLECHAFICRRDAAANALVRCCTHAYADFLNAKRLSVELGGGLAQLQQKLMANASGSASYYTGGESSATINRAGRGEENQPRRHSRSSSVGRAHNNNNNNNNNRRGSSGGGTGGGQYQEVEAIVQQHQPRHAHQSKRPAQSLSTGGTNSQEMTHSEENSLEDEANDYAIISRQAHRRNSRSSGGQVAGSGKSASSYQQMRSSRSRRADGSSTARRHRRAGAKGSSKSLFTDFQPQAQQVAATNQRSLAAQPGDRESRDALDRLSHSLDHLQMAATCCQGAPSATTAGGDSTGETSQGDNQIKYSIVSGKHKRHSRSMQQLLHPTMVPPLGAPPPPPPLPADFDAAQMGGSLGHLARRRKAASYQDIFVAAPESAGGSLSRRSSTSRQRLRRSRRASRYSRSSSMSSLQDSSLVGSQTFAATHAHQRRQSATNRKCSLETTNPNNNNNNSNNGNYNGIYATCDEVGLEDSSLVAGQQGQLRVLGPDCCVQQQQQRDSQTLKRQSKSRRHSEKREQRALELQQQQQMMAAYCAQQPPPLPPHHAHMGAPYSPQPMMVPAHPLYQSAGGYYMPPAGGALYDSPYLATSPPALPPSTPHHLYQPAYHAQAPVQPYGPPGARHPAFQPATISVRHSHQQQPTPLMTVAGRLPKSATSGGGGTTKSAKSKSQTLATRFRCLSPPVNFFSGSGAARAAPQGDHRPISGVQPEQPQLEVNDNQADLNNNNNNNSNNRQSIASVGGSSSVSSTTTTSERISPSQVVSGQPGFLASAGGQAANSGAQVAAASAAAAAAAQSRPGRRSSSKLSWIKRLSLTLSGGSGGGGGGCASGQIVSSAPSGAAHTAATATAGEMTTMAKGGISHPEPPVPFSPMNSNANSSANQEEREEGGERENNGRSLLSDQVAASGEPQLQVLVDKQQPSAATSKSKSGGGGGEEQAKKSKRAKRAGLFSGTLTLGRSSKAKAVASGERRS